MAVSLPGATGSRRRVALLLLAGAVVLLFHPLLIGGVLYFRDVSLTHFPARLYTAQLLRAGELPRWNPFQSGGLPFAANPNLLLFHPTTLLFLVLPAAGAFHAAVLVQFFLAAWGMFRWREEGGSSARAATLGAASYAFSGALVSCGSLQNLLAAWAWVPAGLFAIRRHRRTGGIRPLVGFAAVLAVTLVAGDPVAAAVLALAAVGGSLATGGIPPDSRPRRLLAAGAAVGLGIALAAIEILPAQEMLAHSGRAGGIAREEALAWNLPPIRLLEAVVPGLYGDPTALSAAKYWGGQVLERGYPFLLSVYLGALPVVLVFAALARGAGRKRWIVSGLTFGGLLLSLGEAAPLYPALYDWLPGFSSLRYPSRFILPASLGLAWLAATGLDRIEEEGSRPAGGPATRTAMWGGAVLGGAALAMAAWPPGIPDLLRGGLGLGGPAIPPPAIASLRGGFLRAGLLAALLVALLALVRRGRMPVSRAAGLAATVAALDLIAAHLGTNPVVGPEFYQARPPLEELSRSGEGSGRVYVEPRPSGFAVKSRTDSASAGYYWDQVSCRLSACLPRRIPMVYDRSTDLLSPPAINRLSEELPAIEPSRLRRMMQVASVGVVESYRELPDPELVPSGEVSGQTSVPLRFYRVRHPLPRAYLVWSARPERGDPLSALTDASFDPRREVYLSGNPRLRDGPGGGRVDWISDRPERIELDVEAAGDGILVLADNFYPGWEAEVDGRAAPILRANFLFRGVEVPAGRHRVEFRYSPAPFRHGAALSLLGLGTALAAMIFSARGRR